VKIIMHVCPEKRPMNFAEFMASHPKGSVAVDGYCDDAPVFDSTGWANFDHHVGVNRLATRATAAQIALAIRMHVFDSWVDADGNRTMHVYVNDVDPDVQLSVWLLKNMGEVGNVINPALNRLIQMCDYLDTTGGTYPFPLDMNLETYDWCFEPYFAARLDGTLDRKNPEDYLRILTDCGLRIRQHLMGHPGVCKADDRYNVLYQGQGWCIAEEVGYRARMKMVNDGHKAWILARPRADGRWTYTVQRLSEGIHFNVRGIIDEANRVENETIHQENEANHVEVCDVHWGCGPTIGGSDRFRGSKFSPTSLVSIIEAGCL
jgi:hypothetical protein